MNVQYAILFTVDLLHEYYSNGRSDDFDLVPAEDTVRLLKTAGVLWKKSGNRYFALIKATDKGGGIYTPSVNTPPEQRYRDLFGKNVFRFYLILKNPYFSNFTALNQPSGRLYYFSNAAANGRTGVLYLNLPVANHANGVEYLPGNMATEPGTDRVFEAITKHTSSNAGELGDTSLWLPKGLRFLTKPLKPFTAGKLYQQGEWVTGGGNNVFEAVRTHTGVNVAELSDTALWKARGEGEVQYPNPNDETEYCTSRYLFTLSVPAQKADISFFAFNYNDAAPAYDVPVGTPETQIFTAPQAQVSVDLANRNPGRYLVKVNGDTKLLYYDPAFTAKNIFGVIEIFNHLPGTNDYAFLSNDEDIRQVNYALHFATRRVLWKYRRKDGRAQAITDTGGTGYSFTAHGDDFVSDKPIPLSQDAVDTLELTFTASDFKLSPLPNPPATRLGRFAQNGYDYFTTELFLNY